MKLEKGQYIECALKNGWIVSGTIDDISSTALQLTRSDGKGIAIILRPNEEIVVIKIPFKIESVVKSDDVKKYPENDTESQINKPSMPHEDPDTLKTLSELRVEYLEQEKQEISNKLRSHEISDVRKVEYGYPGFFKKPSAK